ncbi:MAG: hypothetical protein VR64_15095 [Desulfatitalea sp. BRH_c12]|nr:MAG: hypothetical protein VR64_15095 [Desulfatitalea sp. BRH_c12]
MTPLTSCSATDGRTVGKAPDANTHAWDTALVLIDVINDLEFDEGPELLKHALTMADHVAGLKIHLRTLGMPVIYANDNFGNWQTDFRQLVDHCLHDQVTGKPIAEKLFPQQGDHFILKPQYSAFFATPLEILLKRLNVRRLILTGMSGNICVFFTAADAYMRGFELIVPEDCIACINPDDKKMVLGYMQTIFKADIRPSTELPFSSPEMTSDP